MTVSRSWIFAFSLLYVTLLSYATDHICHYFKDVPGYNLCGSPNFLFLVIAVVVVVLSALLLPLGNKASTAIIWIVFLTHIASALIVSAFVAGSDIYRVVFFVSISILYVIFVNLAVICRLYVKYIKIPQVLVLLFVLAIFIVFLGVIGSYFSFSFDMPSITDVYGVRSEYKERIAGASLLIPYMVIIGGYSISPFMTVMSVINKKNIIISVALMAMATTLSILIYSSAAFKSVAFAFVIVGVACVILSFWNSAVKGFFVLTSLGFVFILIYGIVDSDGIAFIHWFRRVFIVPGLNANFYLDYIGIFDTKSLINAPFVISQQYYNTDGSANNGIIGSGLAEGGYFGVVMNITLFSFMLIIIDSVTRGIPAHISTSLFIPTAYAFANSAPTTVLLSYGLLSTIVLAFVSRSAIVRSLNITAGRRQRLIGTSYRVGTSHRDVKS